MFTKHDSAAPLPCQVENLPSFKKPFNADQSQLRKQVLITLEVSHLK
jgi:hypothetical protein